MRSGPATLGCMAETGVRGADEYRRRVSGAPAVERAIIAGEPVRIILHARGSLSEQVSRVLELAAERGIETRPVGNRELVRVGHLATPIGSVAAADEHAKAPGDGEGEVGSASETLLAYVGPDPDVDLPELLSRGGAVWVLVGTAYPGNAGFVIRTAEVSGAAGVVIDASFGRTDKRDAQRAAMRADRYLPLLFDSAEAVADAARRSGHRIIAIEDVGRDAPWEVDLRGDVVFVVGGEEHGVPAELIERADEVVRIPMVGFMPSYNLQAAMAAVMAERLRQLANA
jgi:tRNA G18 (ribose-2'-O)-methylase SpoU